MRQDVGTLLALNELHSQRFVGEHLMRRQYRAVHTTELGAFKCMDGRINLPMITNTPLGIIQPWRNLGGIFDLGWPFFQETVKGWIMYAVDRGRDCIIFVTYHFSRGDLHRGCRGFNYDKDAAIAAAQALKLQCESVFGTTVVFPILCGIETDFDSLVLHGDGGETIDLACVPNATGDSLNSMIRRLFPAMPDRIRNDLLPLVQGNIAHIAEIRAKNRPLTVTDHQEWVLALGRGFDWLHEPNTALIVGPYDPNLDGAIETAALLLKSNVDAGRVLVDGANGLVLLTSAPYRSAIGPDPRLAAEKAKFLSRFARKTIKERVPDLMERLTFLTGTVDMETRKFTPIGGC